MYIAFFHLYSNVYILDRSLVDSSTLCAELVERVSLCSLQKEMFKNLDLKLRFLFRGYIVINFSLKVLET